MLAQVLIKTADWHRRRVARYVRAGMSRTPPPSHRPSNSGDTNGGVSQAVPWGTPESGVTMLTCNALEHSFIHWLDICCVSGAGMHLPAHWLLLMQQAEPSPVLPHCLQAIWMLRRTRMRRRLRPP